MYHNLYKNIIRSSCVLCDNAAQNPLDLCDDCRANLPCNSHPCTICALPLEPPTLYSRNDLANHGDLANQGGLVDENFKCGACTKAPGPITRSVIPYLYRPPADFMIRRLKYAGDTKYSRLVGELICQAVKMQATTSPDCLIPVPMHNSRYRERGFNQAHLIAGHISSHLKIPLHSTAVSRTIANDTQATLGARARQRNMRRAFSVTSSMKGRSIAIVDDVYTTGATCTALARLLISSGAQRVEVWAFARTP